MTLDEVRRLARRRPEHEFVLNRFYGARVSPFFTVVCLRLGLSPDQVTIVGAAFGASGIALLFLPLGWWSILAVVSIQIGYVLDFSDGQVARMTDTTSAAGSYLDWLTHFYIPVGAALAMAASLAWSTGEYVWLVLGTVSALELAAFAFSCKEHALIAMARKDPLLAGTSTFHAALSDDARLGDVVSAGPGPAVPEALGWVSGRRHGPSVRSVIGELLIYPGAAHLLTVAVTLDFLMASSGPPPARGALLVAWALLFVVHAPMTISRNHAVIRAVEQRGTIGERRE